VPIEYEVLGLNYGFRIQKLLDAFMLPHRWRCSLKYGRQQWDATIFPESNPNWRACANWVTRHEVSMSIRL